MVLSQWALTRQKDGAEGIKGGFLWARPQGLKQTCDYHQARTTHAAHVLLVLLTTLLARRSKHGEVMRICRQCEGTQYGSPSGSGFCAGVGSYQVGLLGWLLDLIVWTQELSYVAAAAAHK